MKKMIKRLFIILLMFLIFFIFSAFSYANSVSHDLANSVFRLHVIANSNSDADQNLKYLVRDDVLKYMNELCINCKTKSEAMMIAQKHTNDFENIAKKTIERNGYNYNVSVKIGNYSFPTKKYGDGIVPEESKEVLQSNIPNEEEYLLINENKSDEIKLKFKIVELFQNVKLKIAQN